MGKYVRTALVTVRTAIDGPSLGQLTASKLHAGL